MRAAPAPRCPPAGAPRSGRCAAARRGGPRLSPPSHPSLIYQATRASVAGRQPDISACMATVPTSPPADEAPSIKLEADRAYLDLRDRIVTLSLAPGTVLREDELMRELVVGRTPLREAVKRLALENLVAVQPRRGTFVIGRRGRRHRQHHRGASRAGGLRRRARRTATRRRPSGRRARRCCARSSSWRRRRPGLAHALRRAHPPLHLGGRRQPLPDRDARALLHPLAAHLVPGARPRCPGLGHAVHDQTHLVEALLAGDAVSARGIMREHVLDFQRELLAAFSRT